MVHRMNGLIRNVLFVTLFMLMVFSVLTPMVYGKSIGKSLSGGNSKSCSFDLKVRLLMLLAHMPSLSACIVKNSTIVWSKTYGFSSLFPPRKARDGTLYMIGSVSKTVTATALMQLYEKGLFDLDDDVSEYLPFVLRNPRYPDVNITFRMLLTHMSSLNDYCLYGGGFLPFLLTLPFIEDRGFWIKENLLPDGRFYSSMYWESFPPGTKFHYSTVGFVVLAYLVECLSNQPFEEYCQENIFEPLHMFNTGFHLKDVNRWKTARPYIWVKGFFVPVPRYDAGVFSPAGGIWMNIGDLSHFLIAHMNGGVYNGRRIISEETVELMHTIQYPDMSEDFYGIDVKYGLGWLYINTSGGLYGGYNGGAPGFLCSMYTGTGDKSNVGVIYLSNCKFKLSNATIKPIIEIGEILFQKAEEIDV